MTSTLIAKHPTESHPQLRAAPGRIELHTASGVGVVSVEAIFVRAITNLWDNAAGDTNVVAVGWERSHSYPFCAWQILEAIDKARELERDGAEPNARLVEIERAARAAEAWIAIILRVFKDNFERVE